MQRRRTSLLVGLGLAGAAILTLLLTTAAGGSATAARTVAKTSKVPYAITGIILKTGGEGAYPACEPTTSFIPGTPGVIEMNVFYKNKQITGTKGLKSFEITLDEPSGAPVTVKGSWDSSSKLWRICWPIPADNPIGTFGYTVVIKGKHGTTKIAVSNPNNLVTVSTGPTT